MAQRAKGIAKRPWLQPSIAQTPEVLGGAACSLDRSLLHVVNYRGSCDTGQSDSQLVVQKLCIIHEVSKHTVFGVR